MTFSFSSKMFFMVIIMKIVPSASVQNLYIVTENVRFSTTFKTISTSGGVECAITCYQREECMSVNFFNATGTCEHSRLISGLSAEQPQTSPGWQIIFDELKNPLSMSGAVAWQSDDLYHPAYRGIDGNTDTNLAIGKSCFETSTSNSWWAVELRDVARMGGVTVYFRTDCCFSRTANLHFLVSLSRSDNDAGIVREVAFYKGPPRSAADNPIELSFTPGTFGKILRINQDLDENFHLCEVFLISPQ